MKELVFVHKDATNDLSETQRQIGDNPSGSRNFLSRVYRSLQDHQNINIGPRFSISPGRLSPDVLLMRFDTRNIHGAEGRIPEEQGLSPLYHPRCFP